MDSFAPLTGLIAAHSDLAYAAVLLLTLSEAVPIIGAVVPGLFLVVAIAALVPTGAVKMWPLMIAAIVGAILGDGLSYWLGHRYGQAAVGRWPLNRYPDLVERSRGFIERHGGKSVFLARFTPGVRAFVPIVAGMLGMPAGRFYLVNILSALAWAPAHILPGALFGASLTLAGAAAGRLALLLAILVVLLWIAISVLRLALSRGVPLLEAGETRLWQWAGRRDTWPARQIRSLLDPERGEGRALLLWTGVVIASAWLFFGILEDVVSGDPLVRLDMAIYRSLQGLRTPLGDAVMIGITELGDAAVITAVAVAIFLWLGWQRAWRAAAYWAAAVGFAAILNTVTKLAIHRARPGPLGYVGASAFSFPSGHATVNAVLYGFLAFLIARQLRTVWRAPVYAAAASFAILIAFSRLYLGAHWFSDVAGSLSFATAWTIVLGLAYVRHRQSSFDRRKLALVAGAVLTLVGGFEVFRSHSADTQRYAVRYETPSIAAADWWKAAWRQLPAYRVDLAGEAEEPLTFQWAGTLQDLESRLLRSDWQRPAPWTLSGTLAWLVTADPRKLPVVPLLEAGRMPGLSLIKLVAGAPNSRIVLRLWPADLDVRNNAPLPLWVGSVVEEHISRPFSLASFARHFGEPAHPRNILQESIGGGRLVMREVKGGEWDGLVLLAEDGSPGLAFPQ